MYIIFIFALFYILFYYSTFKKEYGILFRNIISGIAIFLVIHLVYKLAVTYKVIPEFDFLCFFLFGKAGVSSSDFYNPVVFSHLFNTLNLQAIVKGDSFIKEIVNVGFWYPPPSMFLFLPLGYFDLKTDYIVWQTFVIILFLVDIFLLVKLYSSKKDSNYKGVIKYPLLLLLLILLFPDLLLSVTYSQVVTLFVFLLILLIRYIDSWKAGVFLAILFFIKPLAAIFILYFIFFRKWKAVAATAITGIIILTITGFSFGFETLVNYVTSPPTNRIPDYIYYENTCISLLGVLRRFQRSFPGYISINNIKIIYYLISLCLIIIASYASHKLFRISNTLSFLIFVPLALLIYPITGTSYNLLLLPVVLYIFTQKPFGNIFLNLLLIFFLYVLGHNLLLFNLSLLLILIIWPKLNYIEKAIFLKLPGSLNKNS